MLPDQACRRHVGSWKVVLILVVMEDAPRQEIIGIFKIFFESLNPCCNGRCSPTIEEIGEELMYLSLNPCCNGRCSPTILHPCNGSIRVVLILVVMEDAPRQR